MKFALIVCSAALGLVTFLYGEQSLKIKMASDQIAVFKEMRAKSASASREQILDYLAYVRGYYPSGTKQAKGTSLDEIVEINREDALREIALYLDKK